MSEASSPRVAVIGGGWAGCAAAVELARQGKTVTLFEAARVLGGRARCVEINGMQLDNGQHILLGAYTETLRLMRTIGIDAGNALLRLPLQMRYPTDSGGMDFAAPRLPAPLHLLVALWRASGLARGDKLSLARFSTTARWIDWQLDHDCSVAELLDRFDQTDRLIQLMWRPLCIAALNTPPERASAQIFLNVLRDSLGARRTASDMLLPRVDLSTLMPQQAATYIKHHGGEIHCGTTVSSITCNGRRWRLTLRADETQGCFQEFDAVVIATPPGQAAIWLDGIDGVHRLPEFDYEPISTCYLKYTPETRLTRPFFALPDDSATGSWGQFVFDRGQLDPRQAGLLAVVVSASSDAIACGHEALARSVAKQLANVFKQPGLALPQWAKVISEKRATFSCRPGLVRPANTTGIAGLALAGDYTAGEYPATLESAVRSGVQAARELFPSA